MKVWAPDGRTLYFWTNVHTRNELFAQPVAGGEPEQISDLKGTTGLFSAGAPSISADGRTVAFSRGDLEHPDEVHVAALAKPWNQRALTKLNPELDGIAVHRVADRLGFVRQGAPAFGRLAARLRPDVVVEDVNKIPLFLPRRWGGPFVLLVPHLFGTTAFREVSWPMAAVACLNINS